MENVLHINVIIRNIILYNIILMLDEKYLFQLLQLFLFYFLVNIDVIVNLT